jgi:hypothetical protein
MNQSATADDGDISRDESQRVAAACEQFARRWRAGVRNLLGTLVGEMSEEQPSTKKQKTKADNAKRPDPKRRARRQRTEPPGCPGRVGKDVRVTIVSGGTR